MIEEKELSGHAFKVYRAEDYDSVTRAVEKRDGFCPCMVAKTQDTFCPCTSFKNQRIDGKCHCGRYYKEFY